MQIGHLWARASTPRPAPPPCPCPGAHRITMEWTPDELAAMRSTVLGALSFSVRNDGSLNALLDLFPGDEKVKKKVTIPLRVGKPLNP